MKLRPSHIVILAVSFLISSGFLLLFRMLLKDLESQNLQITEEVMVDISYQMAHTAAKSLKSADQLTPDFCRAAFAYVADTEIQEEIMIHGLRKHCIGLHFYVSDQNGTVLFDSQNGRREGMDFSQMNDVFLSLQGSYGARSSRQNEEDSASSILYVAAPIRLNGSVIGAVTAYKAQSDVFGFVQKRKRQIIQVCLMIGCGIVLLVVVVFFWVYRPIGLLTKYTQEVTDGGKPTYPKLGSGKQINTLGNALKTMRSTLEGREYAKHYVQTLSHELKSPIAAIQATSELLQEEVPEEQKLKFLQSIIEQTNRSERLISRLLQLSRIERIDALERLEPVDLTQLLDEVSKELKSLASQKELTLNIRSGHLEEYRGDPFLLRAAFQNLLENAIQYAPAKTSIGVELRHAAGVLEISFLNEGDPFPSYVREQLFDRFFSHAQGEVKKSTGIGLALAKEAVHLHQGKLTYCRKSGQHQFKITLPHSSNVLVL